MLEVTKQRAINNETLTLFKTGILKLYSKFLSTLQTRNYEVNRQVFIVPAFPLSGKSNYVVEEFSAECQRAIISWDHYVTT